MCVSDCAPLPPFPSSGAGGVPCEPDSIFLICNNFPHNAFRLDETLAGSNFTRESAVWQGTVESFAPAGLSLGQYFNLVRGA